MTDHSDVTVIVTNYNYGDYLPAAVASALAQDGGEPAVVVVDDGSTDPGTDEVLGSLPPQVRVLRQSNAGPSAARNAGIAAATSPYLLVLDADDLLLPQALQALKPPLLADPQLGFTYGRTRFFGAWEGILDLPPSDPFRLLYRHMIGLTTLVRAEVLRDTGGFDPAFKGYEDWELWLHALAHGWEGRRVEVETLHYRRHDVPSVNVGARREYRRIYRRLRAKHAALYRRSAELASRTRAPVSDRVVYPLFWGWRPVPAVIEHLVYARRWRSRA